MALWCCVAMAQCGHGTVHGRPRCLDGHGVVLAAREGTFAHTLPLPVLGACTELGAETKQNRGQQHREGRVGPHTRARLPEVARAPTCSASPRQSAHATCPGGAAATWSGPGSTAGRTCAVCQAVQSQQPPGWGLWGQVVSLQRAGLLHSSDGLRFL